MSLGRIFAVSLALSWAASSGACSSAAPKPPGSSGPVARFSAASTVPAFMDVPYPSDVYLAGGRVAPLPGIDQVVRAGSEFLTHELSKQDGFSRVAMTHYYVDDLDAPPGDDGSPQAAAVDPATLPQTEAACASGASAAFLVDLAATDPEKARVPCRAVLAGWSLSKTRPVVSIGPARGVVLAAGHRYATVLTSRVKTTAGKPLGPSADFAKLLSGGAGSPVSAIYAPALDAVKRLLAGAVRADEIVAIAPLTTHTMDAEIFALRDALEGAPAAQLRWSAADLAPMGDARFSKQGGAGFAATLDAWLGVVDPKDRLPSGTDDPDDSLPVRAHDAIAAVGTAAFDAVNYLQSKPGGYQTLDHATFARDAQGKVVPAPDAPTAKIWVTFAVPAAAMPAAGYPVVVVQHGLSSSRAYMMSLANTFCASGWAVAAIDSVTFGARAPDTKYRVDQHTDWESAPGATYAGPDGFADLVDGSRAGSDNLFGGLKNIGAMRDQLRQAELDTAQLVRLLATSPTLDPLATGNGPPKIDGARVAYVGDSLGGIEGAAAAAIEPKVSAWVLNVAGGGIIQELAVSAPGIYSELALAGSFNFGFYNDQLSEGHPLVELVQTVIELGDPLLYAGRLVTSPAPLAGAATKPRNVLQVEVIFDELVTNEAGEALARAAGFPLAKPNVGSNAGLYDMKKPARGVPLLEASPDGAGAIHDVPSPGVTALVLEDSPAGHGANMTRSKARRSWKAPYALFGTASPFTALGAGAAYDVRTGYRALQATIVRFIGDAFAGKTPAVAVTRAPVRDLDDDGSPDDADADPNDPRVK